MIVEYKVGVIPILKPLFHVFDAWNELLLPFILGSKCLPEVVLGNYDVTMCRLLPSCAKCQTCYLATWYIQYSPRCTLRMF
jgi:hypothetical protein